MVHEVKISRKGRFEIATISNSYNQQGRTLHTKRLNTTVGHTPSSRDIESLLQKTSHKLDQWRKSVSSPEQRSAQNGMSRG
ncbi:MAG: hypothetical protein MK137_07000 [Rickettsiales bacterium]|nr:hypothetical protein [Rickettsiales bacterium]